MRSAVVVTCVLLLAAACGGSVASVPGGSSGSSGSGTSSGGTSGTGTSSGGTSGATSGGVTCSSPMVTTMTANRVCVPAVGAAKTPITLVIDGPSCVPCFSSIACKVNVIGMTINVSMETSTCAPTGDVGCPDICQLPSATCTLPPLDEGTYDVKIESGRSRTLVVAAQGGSTSCALGPPGLPPDPLDVSKLTGPCMVDSDCESVVAGDVCNLCGCPTAAIAVSEEVTYQAALRAAVSQCKLDGDIPPCAPCMRSAVTCTKSGSGSGTCILQ